MPRQANEEVLFSGLWYSTPQKTGWLSEPQVVDTPAVSGGGSPCFLDPTLHRAWFSQWPKLHNSGSIGRKKVSKGTKLLPFTLSLAFSIFNKQSIGKGRRKDYGRLYAGEWSWYLQRAGAWSCWLRLYSDTNKARLNLACSYYWQR